MIITIIGSMAFHKQYEKIREDLKKAGHKIIIPLPDEAYSKEKNIKLKAMEDFNKNLNKSEAILVANFHKNEKQNHIGVNSIMEIGMAFNRNKKTFILNEIPENCKDELEAIRVIELKGNLTKIK